MNNLSQYRRWYLHVLHGGRLTPDNVSAMVETIERQQLEIITLKARLDIDANK